MNGIADHLDDLMRPAAWPETVSRVRLVETHISWVFLTGEYAWKIKKPVDLGFLDFSTLAKRRFFCEEELRLNRRLAPDLYLSVDTVCLHEGRLHIGGEGQVVDHAVRMRQFNPEQQLDHVLARGELTPAHMEQLARDMARFHAAVAVAGPDTPWGEPDAVVAPMRENVEHIRQCLGEDAPSVLATLEDWISARAATLLPVLAQRKAGGFIRECHGDLHLANMTLLDGRVVPFDCLEFNPALRWIDIISEIAFTVMDLEDRRAAALAGSFLNTWLDHSGDHAGIRLLDFYKVYRAMVRAKVNAIRLQQAPDDAAARAAVDSYLALALADTQAQRPVLILTHGLSASGKSTIARQLLINARVIRLRSDVERKRLFGLPPEADSASAVDGGIYTAEATRRTYAQLNKLAAMLLESGYSVILDAAFLRRAQREAVYALAQQLDVPCYLLAAQAPAEVLRRRIAARHGDVSEADRAVLEKQLRSAEVVDEGEVPEHIGRVVTLDTTRPLDMADLVSRLGLAPQTL